MEHDPCTSMICLSKKNGDVPWQTVKLPVRINGRSAETFCCFFQTIGGHVVDLRPRRMVLSQKSGITSGKP